MNSSQSRRLSVPHASAQSTRHLTNDRDSGEAAREFRRLLSKKSHQSSGSSSSSGQNHQTREHQNSPKQGDMVSVHSDQCGGNGLIVSAFPSEEEDANASLAGPLAGNNREQEHADDALRTALAEQMRDGGVQDADEFEPLITSQINQEAGSRGEFELLMPNDQKIAVEYAVSQEAVQVLLKASSRELCLRLRACAEGIGQRMSQRSGRQVDIFAV